MQQKENVMQKERHEEKHFLASDLIRDIVIGMADGLTVPFALAAGLSGTISNTSLVVIAGVAEISAGSIAMGLGGYLAARTDREHYLSELERERREIVELPEREREEVADILREWNLPEPTVTAVVKAISEDSEVWVNFMMKHELGLEEPEPKRARNSSLTIGLSYIVGGIIPLSPYIFIQKPQSALIVSVFVTLIALFIFGFIKGKFTGSKPIKSAWQTTFVGGVAAGFAFLIAKLIS
ncbi:VIT1/CCC1 transporter family protein [Paenibacillus alginolyticus]|uniref:VIT1/CCC1 transporter family protein n=1 Tax=Paenibacillus alginolyticus TaxID=59839 RepID=UPI000419A279|nr:VIT1/CCC1 transporter family protein [Paenibacillus alginolyticus]MCY9670732.1 VIT1/CCC1 transporter family protein [Paenibacillus alginolyticus]